MGSRLNNVEVREEYSGLILLDKTIRLFRFSFFASSFIGLAVLGSLEYHEVLLGGNSFVAVVGE